MYRLKSFDDGYARVVSDNGMYRSNFRVPDEASASELVANLNRPDMMAELAAYRYEVETAGLVLEDGTAVLTTRETQAQVSSVLQSLESEMVDSVRWKGATGWTEIDLTGMRAIATAISQHVDQSFRAEEQVQVMLEAITDHTEMEQFDIQAEFDAIYAPDNLIDAEERE